MTTINVVAGTPRTINLERGDQLTIVADANSAGRVWPFSQTLGDTPGVTDVAAGATVLIGPFAAVTRYQVEATAGSLSVSADPVAITTFVAGAAVADAAGGATVDTECRAALNALLARVRAHGLIAT